MNLKLNIKLLLILLSINLIYCTNKQIKIENEYYLKANLNLKNKDPNNLFAKGKNIMITSDHPLASDAGLEIYKKGGNVVDVALATSFAISVLRPQSTGIAGGGFMLVRYNKKTTSFDFRERAPLNSTKKMFQDSNNGNTKTSLFGWKAVGVPGMVAGFIEVHEKYGNLPLPIIIEPAIKLAREGFLVYEDLEKAINISYKNMDIEMKKVFAPNGIPLTKNKLLIQKNLADTLEIIAKDKKESFYKGNIARKFEIAMKINNGIITKKDLENYKVYTSPPLSSYYKKYLIETMPLPSSGIFVLTMLKNLEKINLNVNNFNNSEKILNNVKDKSLNKHSQKENLNEKLNEKLIEKLNENPNENLIIINDKNQNKLNEFNINKINYYKNLIEIMQNAYQQRAVVGGDPKFYSIPQNLYTNLLKNNYETSPPSSRSKETTHISVIDKDGNAVSTTQSINYLFGARVMLENTGMVMNDTMDDFSSAPGVANAYGLVGSEANSIAPKKTPLSSMSPTFVYNENNDLILSLGSPGGSQIITTVLQGILNEIDFHLHPLANISYKRIHFQNLPRTVFIENGLFTKEEIVFFEKNILDKMNFKLEEKDSFAKLFLVKKYKDFLVGASDPRGDGEPRGD